MCVRGAGRQTIHLHVVLANLVRQRLGKANEGGLSSAVDGEVGPRRSSATTSKDNDFPAPRFHHLGKNGPAGIQHTHEVRPDHLFPGFWTELRKRADWPENSRGA